MTKYLLLIIVLFSQCKKHQEFFLPDELKFIVGTWNWSKTFHHNIPLNSLTPEDHFIIYSKEYEDRYQFRISNDGRIEHLINGFPAKTNYYSSYSVEASNMDEDVGQVSSYNFKSHLGETQISFSFTESKDSMIVKTFPFKTEDVFGDYRKNTNLFIKE